MYTLHVVKFNCPLSPPSIFDTSSLNEVLNDPGILQKVLPSRDT